MSQMVVTLQRRVVLFFRKPHVQKTTKVLQGILKQVFFYTVMFLLYLPILIIAIQSVNDSINVNRFYGLTLRWYTDMFRDPELITVILNTLINALLSTLLATVFGTAFAIGIHSLNRKLRQKVIFLNQIPILNADVVTGISLMLIFKAVMELFPNIFIPLEMILSFENNISFQLSLTVLLSHLFFGLPYVVLSVLPKLSELDENLYDAALDLGSKPFDAIMKVIIPAIRAGIFTGMLMAFTMSIDDFVITFFTSGGNYDNVSTFVYGKVGKIMTPSVYAYNTFLTISVVVVLVGLYFHSAHKQMKLKQLYAQHNQKI